MKTKNSNSLFSLEGKVAVITGASKGIGKGIASIYADAGARLIVCSRKQDAIEKAADELRQNGADVLAVAANVTSNEDRQRLIETALDWGARIDILVNNAGANPVYAGLADLPETAFDQVVSVNLKAPLFLSQLAFGRWMKKNGGAIINVSSIAASRCHTGTNCYNFIKAGLNHLTRCLASEWGADGVRVNALAPGLIRTDFSRVLWENPDELDSWVNNSPISRLGEVEDLFGAALLLASDAATYITGHILTVDGGSLLH